MSLEEFFEKGNKLAIFGSIQYSSNNDSDIDFALFTNNGLNPFPTAPQYSDEIKEFIKAIILTKNMILDFNGDPAIVNTPMPYNVNNISITDDKLAGIFLTGSFFPNNNFLKEKYDLGFGKDYLINVWDLFSKRVERFYQTEDRIGKMHKNLELMLFATKELTRSNTKILFLVKEYEAISRKELEKYNLGKVNIYEYQNNLEKLALPFIYSAREIFLLK